MSGEGGAVEWTDAEREARATCRFALVGQGDGSRHVVWVSPQATTAAYPPEGICDRESWVSFEPLFTAAEIRAREAAAWDEGYMRGRYPFTHDGQDDPIPPATSPPTSGSNANPYRQEADDDCD